MGVNDDIQNTWPSKWLGKEHFAESDVITLTITKYALEPNMQGKPMPTLHFKETTATWQPGAASLRTIISNLGTDDPEEWFGKKINILGEIKYKGGVEQCWKSVIPNRSPNQVVKDAYAKHGDPNAKQKEVDSDDIPF